MAYNFANKGLANNDACWLVSYLQCVYRLDPVRKLLAQLPAQNPGESAAHKFSRLINEVLVEMAVEKKQKYFPDALFNAIYSDMSTLFSKEKIQQKLDAIPDPYSVLDYDQPGWEEKFKEITKHPDAIKRSKLEDYLSILGEYDKRSGGSDADFFNIAFQYILRKTFSLSRQQLGYYCKIGGADEHGYELVAIQLEGAQNGYGHANALIRYGDTWYFYDSYYNKALAPVAQVMIKNGVSQPKPLDVILHELFDDSKGGGYYPKIYFYQHIGGELAFKLISLHIALGKLKQKLSRLNTALADLKNKIGM